jgi:hypothetical protein
VKATEDRKIRCSERNCLNTWALGSSCLTCGDCWGCQAKKWRVSINCPKDAAAAVDVAQWNHLNKQMLLGLVRDRLEKERTKVKASRRDTAR